MSRKRSRLTSGGNLPAEVSSFVGRAGQLRRARKVLAESRLVTLTGVGGVGKTRFALRLAAGEARTFADGVWFIELANLPGTASSSLLEQTVAESLGLRDFSAQRPLRALVDHLTGRHCLLVLDNCEHLVEQAATLVSQVLRAARGLRVLATSRKPLGCVGEHVISVPLLSVTNASASRVGEAVELFRQRAAAVGVPVASDDVAAAIEICRRLDGLPLAIELAAGQLFTLSVTEVLERLEDRFRLLAGGVAYDTRGRQTLRDVMDWSLQLCTAPERLLWVRLSVFSAGFDLDAAEQVCSGDGIAPAEVLELVDGLVRQSLLTAVHDGRHTRYRQLDTLRDYARIRLAEINQVDIYQQRHQDYFRVMAARAAQEWFSARQPYWLSWASRNMQNLRAAMERAVAGPHPEQALEMAVHLNTLRLWFFVGWPSEGRAWLERTLAATTAPGHPLHGRALALAGLTALIQNDIPRARVLIDACRTTTRDLSPQHDLRFLEGMYALFTNDARAVTLLGDLHLSVTATGGDTVTVAHNWAVAAATLGDPDVARSVTNRHLENMVRGEAPWHIAWAQWASAIAHMRNGQYQLALALARDSIRGHSDLGELWGALLGLLAVAWALAGSLRHGENPVGASLRNGAQTVAELLGGAARMTTWFGAQTAQANPFTSHIKLAARTAQEILGEQAFQRAFEAGGDIAASREQAVERLMSSALGSDKSTVNGLEPELLDEEAAQLTEREREIVEMVALGWTNRQITEKLVLSARTVQTHVSNIMRKLSMHNRHEIVLWNAERQDQSMALAATAQPTPSTTSSGATSYEALKY